ncbi:hypothetical protein [Synechococcus sp. RS9902]|uniref:hypothetical protein n=1 Tax=Synechococcus sp. RS9902 TaxID=221345 RepID=UPI00185F98C4|nr:hypothetical protein SynRS9902_02094 [Synechococcus sp. RS9902]
MGEWDFVDDRDLQNWKGDVVCMTCQHFVYGVDQHCRTMVGCNLRQKQLQQGQHLKKRCKLWAPTWQQEMGWAFEAGQASETTSLQRGDLAALRGANQLRARNS